MRPRDDFRPDRGIERLGDTLQRVIAGGVDAVMASYGTASRFEDLLADVGLVLRIDGAGTVLGPMDGPGAQFYTVEDALRLGADALCVTAFPGSRHEEATLEVLARVIRQAHEWGLPVMAEMVPGGFDSGPEFRTLRSVSVAARVAAELGADWVKTSYAPGFEQVIETCYVPVVVLGGPGQDDPRPPWRWCAPAWTPAQARARPWAATSGRRRILKAWPPRCGRSSTRMRR